MPPVWPFWVGIALVVASAIAMAFGGRKDPPK